MIDIEAAKFKQPVSCKCGRALVPGDVRVIEDRVEFVCAACHASVIEIILRTEEANEWDFP
jgi:hypothetical protein